MSDLNQFFYVLKAVKEKTLAQANLNPQYIEDGERAARVILSFPELTEQHAQAVITVLELAKEGGFINPKSYAEYDRGTAKLKITSTTLISDTVFLHGFVLGSSKEIAAKIAGTDRGTITPSRN